MKQSAKKIRVLIIDDSALVRKLLTCILQQDAGIEVVGTAADAYIARDKIKQLKPDVLTLDIEMPKMDGITFLANLMRLHPLPVVMISTLTEQGARVTLDALELGAVEFICKPKLDLGTTLDHYADDVISKVKLAASARVRQLQGTGSQVLRHATANLAMAVQINSIGRVSPDSVMPGSPGRRQFRTTERLIAIGASTGGTEAIRELLQGLPVDSPGVVIAQHIPAAFSKPFADRINAHCTIKVSQALDGEMVMRGHAYIAPGGQHLTVVKDGSRWRCRISDEVPVNRHKPSVDVLFRSVANAAGINALGVILTGMGRDGAQGLKDMQDAGAVTIAQDEASSVVWGMPGAAVQLGACTEVLALNRIASRLMELHRTVA